MKNLLLTISLLLLSIGAHARPFNLVQFKYVPLGAVDADESDFNDNAKSYDQYEMTFDRAYGARLIVQPFYISAQRSYTNLDQDVPDAMLETIALGVAGGGEVEIENGLSGYILGAFGVGSGGFSFKESGLNDWESFVEANIEAGYKLFDRLTIGIGADMQHFGHPGESKATYGSVYLATGISF